MFLCNYVHVSPTGAKSFIFSGDFRQKQIPASWPGIKCIYPVQTTRSNYKCV
jgi:hypothetical protein